MEGETVTAMETIINAASDAVSFAGTCLTTLVENPILAFVLGAGFVGGIGLPLVRKLFRTSKATN